MKLQLFLLCLVLYVELCHLLRQIVLCQGIGPHARAIHVSVGQLMVSGGVVALCYLCEQGFGFASYISVPQPQQVVQGFAVVFSVHFGRGTHLYESDGRNGVGRDVGQQPVAHLQVVVYGVGLFLSFEYP